MSAILTWPLMGWVWVLRQGLAPLTLLRSMPAVLPEYPGNKWLWNRAPADLRVTADVKRPIEVDEVGWVLVLGGGAGGGGWGTSTHPPWVCPPSIKPWHQLNRNQQSHRSRAEKLLFTRIALIFRRYGSMNKTGALGQLLYKKDGFYNLYPRRKQNFVGESYHVHRCPATQP